MVSTSRHRRLHAASIYIADRPCAFDAVRSCCSLHIVTVLTENHIFSCVCVCKAAYKQRIYMAATSERKRAYVLTVHPDSRLCALGAVRSYCSLHIVPFRWYFHCGGGRCPPQITSNVHMQGRYRCYCACIKATWCGSYTYTSDRTIFSRWIRPYLRYNDYIWCSSGFVPPSYHAQ